MNSPYPDTPAERKALQKLKSLQKYQRHRGVEALLHHQLQEKRLQVSFSNPMKFYFISSTAESAMLLDHCCNYLKGSFYRILSDAVVFYKLDLVKTVYFHVISSFKVCIKLFLKFTENSTWLKLQCAITMFKHGNFANFKLLFVGKPYILNTYHLNYI